MIFKLKFAIGIDVSGSISHDMIKDFMGEIYGIMQQFQDFRLRIWTFDTQVYADSFKEFTPMNAEEIKEYEIIGCGGTDFTCNWDFMEQNDINPISSSCSQMVIPLVHGVTKHTVIHYS